MTFWQSLALVSARSGLSIFPNGNGSTAAHSAAIFPQVQSNSACCISVGHCPSFAANMKACACLLLALTLLAAYASAQTVNLPPNSVHLPANSSINAPAPDVHLPPNSVHLPANSSINAPAPDVHLPANSSTNVPASDINLPPGSVNLPPNSVHLPPGMSGSTFFATPQFCEAYSLS